MASEPYKPAEARKLVSEILNNNGTVVPTGHAQNEMRKDGLTMIDVEATLKHGRIYEAAEFERESWRYRFHGRRAAVALSFEGQDVIVIVTVWKEGGR